MKLSEQWLREWCDPAIDTAALAAALTLLGLEVDEVLDVAPGFEGVSVARVDAVEPHPDADRLRVCRVDAGDGSPLTIVCGAPNVRPGLMTALARVGARLPGGGGKLKKAKLRGVVSEGMLCSGAELGLTEQGDGIMELDAEASAGRALAEHLGLDDRVLVVELTPDRGDCLSVRGVARDLGAKFGIEVTDPEPPRIEEASALARAVEVSPDTACVRFAGRAVEGVDLSRASPSWMSERLRRAGIRSINPAVDVTNYVMLERGTPMHAFDLDELRGPIRVRRARQKEPLLLLDGREVELADDTTVIADERGALGIAGIMGGDSTAVSASTSSLFLECALFLPQRIVGKPRRYASQSESSHRFERGVDPAAQRESLDYATALLISIAGGRAGPASDWRDEDRQPPRPTVPLRRERLARVLGLELGDDEIVGILERLGIRVEPADDGWRVTPPSWRYDLAIEEDYIEEVARLHGLDDFPRTVPAHRPTFRALPETRVAPIEIKRTLARRGYQEIVTYAFVDAGRQSLLRPDLPALALANPISAELGVMRTTLLCGLVETALRNQSRQLGSMRLFETGLRFLSVPIEDVAIDPDLGDDLQLDDSLRQQSVLAGLACGRKRPENWNEDGAQLDFFDLKADVETLLAGHGAGEVRYVATDHAFLCPGRRAAILVGGRAAGYLGALNPGIERELGLAGNTWVFETALAPLERARMPVARPVSRFPRVRRDLALLVDAAIEHDALVATVRAHAPDALVDVIAFDLFAGAALGEGKKSLALGLILQDVSRTLEDVEVDRVVARIVDALGEAHGATLRA